MIRKMKRQAIRRTVGRAVYPRASKFNRPMAPEHAGLLVTFTDGLVFKFVSGVSPRGIGRTN